MNPVAPQPVRTVLRFAASLALALATLAPIAARADTVASLLGNFTVNQHSGLTLSPERVDIRHVVVFGQLPALRELHLADADGDGVTTQSERDAYAERLAATMAEDLRVSVDGVRVPLRARRWSTSLPTEQSGFSLRVEVDYAGDLPAAAGDATHALAFANDNYAGRFGWREIAVQTVPSIAAFDTDAFSTSLTAGLTENVQAMPATGPLAERAIHLSFKSGAMPQGAQPLGPRRGTAAPVAAADTEASPRSGNSWIARETRRIVDLVSARDVPFHISLLALLGAVLLGALHAFSPGHGKTVVGAYLVGSRSTPAHAVFLGATVTITHTLGVFALGFATLVASTFIVPERLLPVLSLASGLVVLAIGVALLIQRCREALRKAAGPGYRKLAPGAGTAALASPWRAAAGHHTHGLAFAHGHAHTNLHADNAHGGHIHRHHHDHDGYADHDHHYDGALVHSHGGSVHSHLPPGATDEKVTLRSLIALGVSGGLLPCPSAMVLLLAAIALNKTGYGLLLVLAFSVGLASTLTAVGLVFLYARNRIGALGSDARWYRWVPVASAAVITVVGAAMCYGAFVTTPI